MLTAPSSPIFLILLFWTALYVADLVLQRFCTRRYTAVLEAWGLQLSPGHVQAKTTRLNRWIFRLGRALPGFWSVWFSMGTVFGVAALVAGPFLLAANLVYFVYSIVPSLIGLSAATSGADTLNATEQASVQVLTPIIPGITVPASHFVYFVLCVFISGMLHELGHGLAAVVEGVRVQATGAFMAILYVGAFVELHTEQLHLSRPIQQLRIACAGVWHNFIVFLCALGLLAAMPTLLFPWYSRGSGVVVTEVAPQSALENSLFPGDVIVSLGRSCPVTSAEAWTACLMEKQSSFVAGFRGQCIPTDMLEHARAMHSDRHAEIGRAHV